MILGELGSVELDKVRSGQVRLCVKLYKSTLGHE